MNKIYKVVWSKARNCYVVASELAKRHTKGCGTRSLRSAAVTVGVAATLLGGFTNNAWAASYDATIEAGQEHGIIAGEGITVEEDTHTPHTITISASGDGTTISVGTSGISAITGAVAGYNNGLVTGATVYGAVTGGTLALNGSSITAVGNATVGGTLTVTGDTTIGTATNPANLTVKGDIAATGAINGENITRVTDPGTPVTTEINRTVDTEANTTTTTMETTTIKTDTTTIEGVMSVTHEHKEVYTTDYVYAGQYPPGDDLPSGGTPGTPSDPTLTDTAYSVNIGSNAPAGVDVNLNVYGDAEITGDLTAAGGALVVTKAIAADPTDPNDSGTPANLTVNGDATVTGDATVGSLTAGDDGITTSGIMEAKGVSAVFADVDGLSVTNDAGVGGDLAVTGAAALNGGATVANGLETDTLTATGDSELQGNVGVGGDLAVTGAAALNGGATVANGLETDTLTVTGDSDLQGNATVGGTLAVAGDTTVGDNFKVTAADGSLSAAGGNFTADKDGNVKAAGKLNVEGDTVLNSNLTVGGEALFNEGKTNQVKIDESGIRIGLHSGQVNDEGFYAGGHTWSEAKAAFGSDGRIKGADGAFIVETDGAVTAKSYSVDGKTYIDSKGLNANDQKIRNMAPGEIGPGSAEAVTGGQVYSMRENLQSDINRVGAGAAAMSNLRPVDMGNKFSMAMGVGNYRSKTAMAMGLFYKPSDQVMLNMSGTIGSGHNMIGAGISFALDKVVKPTGSSVAVSSAQVVRLEEENKAIKAELAVLKAAIKAMQKQK